MNGYKTKDEEPATMATEDVRETAEKILDSDECDGFFLIAHDRESDTFSILFHAHPGSHPFTYLEAGSRDLIEILRKRKEESDG